MLFSMKNGQVLDRQHWGGSCKDQNKALATASLFRVYQAKLSLPGVTSDRDKNLPFLLS